MGKHGKARKVGPTMSREQAQEVRERRNRERGVVRLPEGREAHWSEVLATVAAQRRAMAEWERLAVAAARAAGASWDRVSVAMAGVPSGEQLRRRYGGKVRS